MKRWQVVYDEYADTWTIDETEAAVKEWLVRGTWHKGDFPWHTLTCVVSAPDRDEAYFQARLSYEGDSA